MLAFRATRFVLVFVLGLTVGAWLAHLHTIPNTEERTVRDMNRVMEKAGIRKYRFAADDKGIHLIIRR